MLHDFIHAKLFISARQNLKRQSFQSLQSKSFVIPIFLTVPCVTFRRFPNCSPWVLQFFPSPLYFRKCFHCVAVKTKKKTQKCNDDCCIFLVAKSNIWARRFVGKMQGWSFLLFLTSFARSRHIDLMMQGKWRAECLMRLFGFSC